jgi:hypothetical protein
MRKGVEFYKAGSLLFVNVIVVFALVNAVVSVAYKVKKGEALFERPKASYDVVKALGMPALREVYLGYQDDEVRLLIKENWERGLQYDPFLQFREPEHVGKYVNISKHGFRFSKNNGPWPPDGKNLNIFMFGGSTTFGYGVGDDQTIASHLQEFLGSRSVRGVKVYNFGAGFYFSTQV